MLDGKRDNKSDNRLIRYLIALPNGVDVTNHNVPKEYSEVLKGINIDIKNSDSSQQLRFFLLLSCYLQMRFGRFHDEKIGWFHDSASGQARTLHHEQLDWDVVLRVARLSLLQLHCYILAHDAT